MEKYPSIEQIRKKASPSAWDCYRYLTYNMVENTLGDGTVHPLPDGIATFSPNNEEDIIIATRFSHLFIYLAQYKALADANLHRFNSIVSTYKGLLDTSIVSEQLQAYFAGDMFSLPRIRAAYDHPAAPFVGRGIEMFLDPISASDSAEAQRNKCHTDYELLLDSIYAVKGFNLSLELIAREIRVPDLVRLKLPDITDKTPIIAEFNSFSLELRKLLQESDRSYAQEKLEILDTFPMLTQLHPDTFEIQPKVLAQVRRELKDLDLFSANDNRIADLMMNRPKEM